MALINNYYTLRQLLAVIIFDILIIIEKMCILQTIDCSLAKLKKESPSATPNLCIFLYLYFISNSAQYNPIFQHWKKLLRVYNNS